MKKIFAIALALVMVLSMASAFASPCTAGFDWTNASVNACGKAKVEVVPYVKVSDGCGGFTWQVSECAGSVATENVYYALKLTVDANPDAEWVGAAVVKVTETGMASTATKPTALTGVVTKEADKEAVYYWNQSKWMKVDAVSGISVADDVESTATTNKYIFTAAVSNSAKAKVCVKLTSDGKDFVEGVVGAYYVEYDKSAKTLTVKDKDGGKAIVTYTIKSDKVNVVTVGTEGCSPYTAADVEAFFGIKYGTTITQKLLNKNFAWDDSQEDCFKWNATTAIVDNECVVAIPKTGDASVLAWLF